MKTHPVVLIALFLGSFLAGCDQDDGAGTELPTPISDSMMHRKVEATSRGDSARRYNEFAAFADSLNLTLEGLLHIIRQEDKGNNGANQLPFALDELKMFAVIHDRVTLRDKANHEGPGHSGPADDRYDLNDLTSIPGAEQLDAAQIADIHHKAKSVCMIFSSRRMWEAYRTSPARLGTVIRGCKPLNFEDQPIPLKRRGEFTATGFLIGTDRVLTTAHGIFSPSTHLAGCGKRKVHPDSLMLVFGLKKDERTESGVSWEAVRAVSSIDTACFRLNSPKDFCVLRLDESFPGSAILPVATQRPRPKTPVYCIGHPKGLPQKYHCDGTLKDSLSKYQFECDLDLFSGNSGSPIFDKEAGTVIGMLQSGVTDFKQIDSCFVPVTISNCRKNQCERVLDITFLQNIISPNQPIELAENQSKE